MRLKEAMDNKVNEDKIRVEIETKERNIQGMEKMNFNQRETIINCVNDAGMKLALQIIKDEGLYDTVEGFKCICDIKEVKREKENVVFAEVGHELIINSKGTESKFNADLMMLIEI